MFKRDIQGKFALKNDDYREVRSLRLTSETWKAIGIASECLGLTRADYLEHIVKHNANLCITREDSEILAPLKEKTSLDQVLHGKGSCIRHLLRQQNSLLGCLR